MNLEVTKYLPIRDTDRPIDSFSADYFIFDEPGLGLVAQGSLCAPGLGDEMMARLAAELKQQVERGANHSDLCG